MERDELRVSPAESSLVRKDEQKKVLPKEKNIYMVGRWSLPLEEKTFVLPHESLGEKEIRNRKYM